MEAISGAASISQLVVYSLSSVHYLRKLSSELSQGKSVYHEEEKNTRSLLDIVSRLSLQNDVGDCDVLLPILIDISRLACDILHCFQPKIVWGINLTPIINKDKIIAALAVLDTKRQLLHLHITQVNSDILSSLQSGDSVSRPNTKMPRQECELELDGGDVQGISEHMAGVSFGDLNRFTKIRIHHGQVREGAISLTLNPTELSNENRMEANRRNVELAAQRHRAELADTPTRGEIAGVATKGLVVCSDAGTASSPSSSTQSCEPDLTVSVSSLSDAEYDATFDKLLEGMVGLEPEARIDLQELFTRLRPMAKSRSPRRLCLDHELVTSNTAN